MTKQLDQTAASNNTTRHANERVHYWALNFYNNGQLVGKWFELDTLTGDEHQAEIGEWLQELTEQSGVLCEEYIVGDAEGIPSKYVGEYAIGGGAFVHLEKRGESSLSNDLFDAIVNELEIDPEDVEDCYLGSWDSLEDYAYDRVEDQVVLDALPQDLRGYFDYEAYARDLEINGLRHIKSMRGECAVVDLNAA